MVPVLVGAFFIDGLIGLWLGFAVFAAAALSDFSGRLAGAEARSALAAGADPRSHRRQAPGRCGAGHAGQRRQGAGDRRGGDPRPRIPDLRGSGRLWPAPWRSRSSPSPSGRLPPRWAPSPCCCSPPLSHRRCLEPPRTDSPPPARGCYGFAVVLTWGSAIGYVRDAVRGLRAARSREEE
ncbi:hypothetical protein GBAR_LOCUS29080 [Geodia barretti]|uniref:Uncharacterized protein n=1 Tax=Geodia barretti TaxID=519541 RepID=A0AA35TRK8_GEOBA|nr:hypothetical protein GBAR_LOCUS29080 [Geodia barretti]